MRPVTTLNHAGQNLQGMSTNGSPYILNYSPGRGGVSYLQPAQNPPCYPSLSLYPSACPSSHSGSTNEEASFPGNRYVSTIIKAGPGVLIRAPHIPVYYLQQQQQQLLQQPQHVFFHQHQQQQHIHHQDQNVVSLGSYSGEPTRHLSHPYLETDHQRNNDDPRTLAAPNTPQFELLPHQSQLDQIAELPQGNQVLQRQIERDYGVNCHKDGLSTPAQCSNLALTQGSTAPNAGGTCEDHTSTLSYDIRGSQLLGSSCSLPGTGAEEYLSDGLIKLTGQLKQTDPNEKCYTKKSCQYKLLDVADTPQICLVCNETITYVDSKHRETLASEQTSGPSASLSSEPVKETSSDGHSLPNRGNIMRGIALKDARLSTSNAVSSRLLEEVLGMQVSSSKTSVHCLGKENHSITRASCDKKNQEHQKGFDNRTGTELGIYSTLREEFRKDVSEELHQSTQPKPDSSNLPHDKCKSFVSSDTDVVCQTCWDVMERIDKLDYQLTLTRRILIERHLKNSSDVTHEDTASLVGKSMVEPADVKSTNTRAILKRRFKPVAKDTLQKKDPVTGAACSRADTPPDTEEGPTESADKYKASCSRVPDEVDQQVQSDSEEQVPEPGEEENVDDPDYKQRQRAYKKKRKDKKCKVDKNSEINAMIEFVVKKKRKDRRLPPEQREAALPSTPADHRRDRRCPRCSKMVLAGSFLRHLHRHKLAPCPFCSTCYASTELKLHLLSTHREHRSFPCLECSISVSSYRHLRVHQLTEHVGVSPARPVACLLCKGKFSSPSAARRHVQSVHLNSAAYQCLQCPETFNQKGNLDNHVRRIHRKGTNESKKNCVCEVCDKRFEYPCDVREHFEKVHLNVNTKTSVCEICGKSFADGRSVKTHINAVHTKAIKYPCPYCELVFHSQTNMTSHKRRMHEAHSRKYKCDVCMKGFCNPSSVTTHKQVVHEKLVRFTCDICPQGFKVQSQLKYHRRKHTGECPYQCPHCYKSFPGPSHIANHVRKVHKTIYIGANQRRKLNLSEAAAPPPPGILTSRECHPKSSMSKVTTERECAVGTNEMDAIGLPCEYNQRNTNSNTDKTSQERSGGANTETLQMIVSPQHVLTLAQHRADIQVNTMQTIQVDLPPNISGHNPQSFQLQQHHHHPVFVQPQEHLHFTQQSNHPDIQQQPQPSIHNAASQVMNQQLVLQPSQVPADTLVGSAAPGVSTLEVVSSSVPGVSTMEVVSSSVPGVSTMEVVSSYSAGQCEQTVVRLVHDVQFESS